MSDLLTQPAVDLLALLAAKELSALELAEQHIQRIEQLNPQLNALVDFDPDGEEKVITAICAPLTNRSEEAVRRRVEGMGAEDRRAVLAAYVGDRTNRRHRPGRAPRPRLRPSRSLLPRSGGVKLRSEPPQPRRCRSGWPSRRG